MHQKNASYESIETSKAAVSPPDDSLLLSYPSTIKFTSCFNSASSFRKGILLLFVAAVFTLQNVSTSMAGTDMFSLESNALMTAIGLGQEQPDDDLILADGAISLKPIMNKSVDKTTPPSLTDTNVNHHQTTTLSSCKILIYSKTFDGHYEIFESIARKYPLPFSSSSSSSSLTKCQNAGKTPDTPIVVDFVMPFQWQGGYKNKNDDDEDGRPTNNNNNNAKKKKKKRKRKKASVKKKKTATKESEGWGWTSYFQQHLQNSTAQRIDISGENDGGRYIFYANVLGLNKQSFQSISWKSYSFLIEASCDMWGNKFWKEWLAKDTKRHYCVFHRKHEQQKLADSVEKRTCYLNPQFEQGNHCWFLPTVYPKFPKPAAPFTKTHPKLNICIGWKSMGKGTDYLRDESLLVRALSNLSNNKTSWNDASLFVNISNNNVVVRDVRNSLQVLVIGRNARVPEAFVQAKMERMVQVHNNLVSFYEYQQLIATQCHALVPLVHPEQTAYFLTAPKSSSRNNNNNGDKDDNNDEASNNNNKAKKTEYKGHYQGRLSGMIAQLIGNQIPSLVHGVVADIYQHEFTAPYFVYNVSTTKNDDGGKTFQVALEGLIEYYYKNNNYDHHTNRSADQDAQ